jgi:YVTN family beta-propeller protein
VVGAIGIVISLAPMALPIEQKGEFYVINVKPASVTVVDSESLKTLGTIPLGPNPSYAVIGPQNRYLYVLHNGVLNPSGELPKVASELSILDTYSRELVKMVPVGWNAAKLSFSKDDRYLLCFSVGRAGKKKVEPLPASVTVIDTATNKLEADLSAGRLGKQILFTGDASRIFVLSRGEESKKKSAEPPVKPALTIFSLDSEGPLAVIELPHEPAGMALSEDEKWLYVLDVGNPSKKKAKYRDGEVHVVDLATMKLAGDHNLGTFPRNLRVDANTDTLTVLAQVSVKDRHGKLYQFRGNQLIRTGDLGETPMSVRRFPGRPGLFVMSHDAISFLPDEGPLASSFIALNPKNKIVGYPGETLYLPAQNKVFFTLLNWYGGGTFLFLPTSKVALVDLNSQKMDHVITTGRGGIKFAKTMGAIALSAALSYMSYSAGYSMARSTGSSYFFYNVYAFKMSPPNLSLAASPDGKFVYVLNTFSDDVTIINSEDGSVLDKIAVGGSCRRIQITPGGRYVCAYASKKVTLIDTQTQKPLVHELTNGRVNSVNADEASGRILVLTTDSILVLDAEKGSVVGSVLGLTDPRMLVLPRARASIRSGLISPSI